MQIIINDYFKNRIIEIINIIENSMPGKRRWQESNKFSSGYDYTITERSTFPWWIKFAFEKKPKNYYSLTENEKRNILFFQTNKRDILISLRSLLKNGKIRTRKKELFFQILFKNFYKEEQDYYERWNESLIQEFDMSNCPF